MTRRLEGTRLAAATATAALTVAAVAHGAGPHPHASPPKAPSSPGHTVYQSRHLWATVDLCDTPAHPRTVGVRASMPGSGLADESMYLRFQIEYEDATGTWRDAGASGDSGFIAIGSSTFKARQAGRDFQLAVTPGVRYVVRAVVTFEWRRKRHVVRNAQKTTTAGHRALAGADPPGYSAAACELS